MISNDSFREIPLPDHFDPELVGKIWRVNYQLRADQASGWANEHQILPANTDPVRIALIIIDAQNSFCIPDFELFVGGRSGTGAVEDNRRLCAFIYRNLNAITHITATMDTHTAVQIFHPIFLIDEQDKHPNPMTLITYEDVAAGRWRFNPSVASSLGIDLEYGQQHLLHYTKTLQERQKYDLTVWPYHVMLGSIGHALVPAVEEAIFFHTIARKTQAEFEIKGSNPLTEHYSAIGPEVLEDASGRMIAAKDQRFLHTLQDFDAVIIAGQAKSHCVAWTIADLLDDLLVHDERLVEKVYLLEDCTSPVVVPGVVDFTDLADAAFQKFSQAGMHVVRSSEPIGRWLHL